MSKSRIQNFYEKNQSTLWIIPVALLVLAILFIGGHFMVTGDFFKKDISLSGGISGTVELSDNPKLYQTATIQQDLEATFSGVSFEVSQITSRGDQVGIIIDSSLETSQQREEFTEYLQSYFGVALDQVTIEQTESSFGASFFINLLLGILFAFALMAGVVYLTFKQWYPSALVIMAVFSDIIITLAAVTFLDVKISAAGIAGFLMIIGYAVDTNILLSYRVLRSHDMTQIERVVRAAQTGLLMSGTTFAAMFAALLVTNSAIISQILLVLTIALVVDVLNTWLLNAYLLQRYVKKLDSKTKLAKAQKHKTRGSKK